MLVECVLPVTCKIAFGEEAPHLVEHSGPLSSWGVHEGQQEVHGISVAPIDRPYDGAAFNGRRMSAVYARVWYGRGHVPIPLVDIPIAQDDLGFGISGDQLGRKQSGGKVGDGLWA